MINRQNLLSGTRPEIGNKIIITIMDHFQGYEIMVYKGMVWGISMRSKDVGQDILMGCKQFIGGELTSYTELSDESRQRAIDRMVSMARKIGANAIINFKFEQNFLYGGNIEVTAFGNAVVIKPIKNYVPIGGLGNILAEFVDTYSNAKNSESILTKQEQNPKTDIGEFINKNNCLFVACPHCGMLYGTEQDQNGQIKIKNFDDINPKIEGQQICCIKCNKSFSVPIQ